MPKIKSARKRKPLHKYDSDSMSNCSSESEEESESEIEEATPLKSKGKRKVSASSAKSKQAHKASKPFTASKLTPDVTTKKKKQKVYRQKTLFPESSDEDVASHKLHVKLICPSKTYGGESALFTDEIYGNKLPADAKGKLFKYRYHDYLPDKKTFTLKYVDQAIELRGVDWIEIFQEILKMCT